MDEIYFFPKKLSVEKKQSEQLVASLNDALKVSRKRSELKANVTNNNKLVIEFVVSSITATFTTVCKFQ